MSRSMSTSTQPGKCGFPKCIGAALKQRYDCNFCKRLQVAHHVCTNMYIHEQRLTLGGKKPQVRTEGGVEIVDYFEVPQNKHYCSTECLFGEHTSLKPWMGQPPQKDSAAQQQQAANPPMRTVPFGTSPSPSCAPVPGFSPKHRHPSNRAPTLREKHPFLMANLVPVCNFTCYGCPGPMSPPAEYPSATTTQSTQASSQKRPVSKRLPQVAYSQPPFGLRNNHKKGLYNICYMNAVIQMLLHPFNKPNSDPVIQAIKSIHDQLLATSPNEAAPQIDVSSVLELMDDDDDYLNANCRSLFPRDQEADPHEFFLYLMKRFEAGLPHSRRDRHEFHWRIIEKRYCLACNSDTPW